MQLRLSGRVAQCACRFTRGGVPVLEVELRDERGQIARITHSYPDNSHASGHAAAALAARLRGQHIELDVLRPRFRLGRLDAVAEVIHLPTTYRKDIA